MKNTKNIGIKVNMPKETCEDVNCPFHGQLKIKTNSFVGTVISSKMQKSITIELPRTNYIPKFERYEKRRTRIKAHNPPCLNVKDGDVVKIVECRPLSKSKNYVVVEKITHSVVIEREDMFDVKKKKVEAELK